MRKAEQDENVEMDNGNIGIEIKREELRAWIAKISKRK